MKICGLCKVEKEISEFHKNSKKIDGLQSECKSCKSTRYKGYYSNDRLRYFKNAELARNRANELIRSKKDVPCTDCGIKYPYYVMDFDHLGLEEKIECVARMTRSYKKLEKEIAKCEVVCSNCHRERTHSRLAL